MLPVEIHLPGRAGGHAADVVVAGERLRGVTGVRFDWPTVSDVPTLTVDFAVHPVDFYGEAHVYISDRARETLIRFGWTPPPGDPKHIPY